MAEIRPYPESGDEKELSLDPKFTPDDITKILGFPPNVKDDEDKVKYSWGFTVDGVRCGIWDYKGARWSAFGPKEAFQKIGLL